MSLSQVLILFLTNITAYLSIGSINTYLSTREAQTAELLKLTIILIFSEYGENCETITIFGCGR